MKTAIKLCMMLYAFSSLKAQGPPMGDSTFYYLPDGTKNWFYYQHDAAVFRMQNGAAFTGTLPAWVTSIQWIGDEPHGYNVITYDSSATGIQEQATWYYVNGYPGFDYGFIPVTKDKGAPALDKKWIMGSDLISVRFKEATISQNDINGFMTRNNLTPYHQPDAGLPAAIWTYVFRLSDLDRFAPFDACANIWLNEQQLISHCEPDMLLEKADACTLPTEFAAWANTAHPNALWHLSNSGGTVINGFGSGLAGADINVCDCWGAGYIGIGAKVAVVDLGGFDYTHPDLYGTFLPGYDFVSMTSFTTTRFANADTHGMQVASVIGSLHSLGQTTLQAQNVSAVGVAPGAQIIPYISTLTNPQLSQSVQRAVLDGADIMNWSHSQSNTSFTQSPLYGDILNAISLGRNGLGMIFVGSVGNDNQSKIMWPAAMQDVIGVGATDPLDYRGSSAQANPWDWTNVFGGGSNYNSYPTPAMRYDVMAPGTMIRVAYTQNALTNPQHVFNSLAGTSYAAPIVTGIAAIILGKYPTMPYQQVINMIDLTADKIRTGTTYNYNQYSAIPGYAEQTFFGRINCNSALNNPSAGVPETKNRIEKAKLAYMSSDQALLMFNAGTNPKGYTLDIYDLGGRLVKSQKVEANKYLYSLNTETLPNGVYLLKLTNAENGNGQTFKYVK